MQSHYELLGGYNSVPSRTDHILSIHVSTDGDLAALLCSRQQGMGSSFPISSPAPVILHLKKKKKSNQPSGSLIMALICISLMTNNVVIYSSPLPSFKLGCLFVFELYKLFVFSGF